MNNYTKIDEAVNRITKAISDLDQDIKEFKTTKPKDEKLNNILYRSEKVKQNLVIFKHLFENISLN